MLSVFSPIYGSVPACQYYRIETPMRSLLTLHGVNAGIHRAHNSDDLLMKAIFSADIAWTYSPAAPKQWLDMLMASKGMQPVKGNDGTVMYPPLFVWDADDNLDFTSPFNQSFSSNGVRNVDGTLLEPGDVLTTIDASGKEIELWRDGVTSQNGEKFDIASNLNDMRQRHLFIKNCAGATACSQDLANYYRDALGQKNVHVYHNTIVPEHYAFNVTPLRTDPEGTVRIFWQGGQSHLSDWMPLKKAVGHLARKYPNTKWIFFGCKFDFVFDEIPESQREYHDWTHYEAYRLRRTLFNVDINLCPLADTIFNRSKSAIKWYESTVSPNLEATLAQNVGPYKEIEDGKTGLLFNNEEEFIKKLSLLIEDSSLRLRLGEGAREWVNNNRLPHHTAGPLFEFFTELKARQAAELSPKIIPATPLSIKEALAVTR